MARNRQLPCVCCCGGLGGNYHREGGAREEAEVGFVGFHILGSQVSSAAWHVQGLLSKVMQTKENDEGICLPPRVYYKWETTVTREGEEITLVMKPAFR